MTNKAQALLNRVGLGRMSAGEYQANQAGLNTFFGAVLGFVLTGTEKLTNVQFGIMLASLAGVVITILYISFSRQRLVYAGLALVYAAVFPHLMDAVLGLKGSVPERIQPTLVVWVLLAVVVEFWAREKGDPSERPAP